MPLMVWIVLLALLLADLAMIVALVLMLDRLGAPRKVKLTDADRQLLRSAIDQSTLVLPPLLPSLQTAANEVKIIHSVKRARRDGNLP